MSKSITYYHRPADNRDGSWSCSECDSVPDELWECESCGKHFCKECAEALLKVCGGYSLDYYTGKSGFCDELICEECRDKQGFCNDCVENGAVRSAALT